MRELVESDVWQVLEVGCEELLEVFLVQGHDVSLCEHVASRTGGALASEDLRSVCV